MEVSCDRAFASSSEPSRCFALVIVWSLLAMALAQVVLVRTNGALDFAYYVVAGLGWVPLAMLLVSWMSRGEKGSSPD